MNINEIKDLMQEFAALNLSGFELRQEDFSLCLKKEVYVMAQQAVVAPQPVVQATEPQQPKVLETSYTAIKAPVVGVFYESGQPGAAPFVAVGSKVKKGDILCLIEAMKVLNEVPSPVSGVVKKIVAQNEQLVAYGETLFEIEE